MQVKFVDLDQADDLTVWNYAKDNGFTIVTKDSDFHELSLVYGNPPKILCLPHRRHRGTACRMLHVPYVSLPNNLLGTGQVPEYLQSAATLQAAQQVIERGTH